MTPAFSRRDYEFRKIEAFVRDYLQGCSYPTWLHSKRVAAYVVRFANYLGMPVETQRSLYQAAILHDVGKPVALGDLLDSGLSIAQDEEAWHRVQKHPTASLVWVSHLWSDPLVYSLVQHHHCRGNGRGYPDVCHECKTLPRELWVLILCDCYDALTGLRSYSQPLEPRQALLKLRNDARAGDSDRRNQLDFDMTEAFNAAAMKGTFELK